MKQEAAPDETKMESTLDSKGNETAKDDATNTSQPAQEAPVDAPNDSLTSDTNMMEDPNFDSMFGDNDANIDANNDLDFALDLTGGDTATQDFMAASAFDNSQPAGKMPASNNDNSQDFSFLPGLETYAANADDINMLDMPQAGTAQDVGVGQQQQQSQNANGGGTGGDINFDDMLMDTGDLGAGNGGADDLFGDEAFNGEIGDFDDSWFKTT